MKDEQLRKAAQGVIDTAPAALKAVRGAMDRLNAPFLVRAWHQWRGDDGWGLGDELYMCYWIGVLSAAAALLFALNALL